MRKEDFSEKLLQGCRNYLKWMDVQKGDNVLIIYAPDDDLKLIDALYYLCDQEFGTKVCAIMANRWGRTDGPPQVIAATVASDIVLTISDRPMDSSKLLRQRHAREFLYNPGNTGVTTVKTFESEMANFPTELLKKIGEKILRRLARAKTLKVTTATGTDVSMGINLDYAGANIVGLHWPGCYSGGGFPSSRIGIVPMKPYNGVIAVNLLYYATDPPEIFLKEPLYITVENERAVKFEGPHAEWAANYLDQDKNGRLAAECMWGNNPKAYPYDFPKGTPRAWMNQVHDTPESLHFAFGSCIGGAGPHYSKVHWDVYVIRPTLEIDGEPLIEKGRHLLLEDPEIRKEAAKFGDPDELLKQRFLPKKFIREVKTLPENRKERG